MSESKTRGWWWQRLSDWLVEDEAQADVRFLAVVALVFALMANFGVGCEQSARRTADIRCGCDPYSTSRRQ